MKPILIVLFCLMCASYAFCQTMQERLRLNAFMTVAYVRSNAPSRYLYVDEAVNDEGSYTAFTNYALQFNYEVNNRVDLTVQLAAKGADDFEVKTNWAYLSYRLTSNLSVKAGKVRLPFLLFSDTRLLTYAMPWLTPPPEVYLIPPSTLTGIDLWFEEGIGKTMTIAVQVLNGRNNFTQPQSTYTGHVDVPTSRMVDINLSSLSWMVHTAYWQADYNSEREYVDGSMEPSIQDGINRLKSIGFRFDNDTVLLLAEWVRSDDQGKRVVVTTDEEDNSLIHLQEEKRTINQWYATFGFHLTPSIMPHITSSAFQSDFEKIPDTSLNISAKETARTIGIRTEIGESASFKIDYSLINTFDGKAHGFDQTPEEPVKMVAIGFDAMF